MTVGYDRPLASVGELRAVGVEHSSSVGTIGTAAPARP